MAKTRKSASPHDRTVAIALWILIGAMCGFAIGVFTGHGWIFLVLGIIGGVVLAYNRTRPTRTIEED